MSKNTFGTLELNVETLRELTDDQLSQVAGGAVSNLCDTTKYLPSGSAYTMNCSVIYNTTGIVQTG